MVKLFCPFEGCNKSDFGTSNPQQKDVSRHLRQDHDQEVTNDNLQHWRERQNASWETCDKALAQQLRDVTKTGHDDFREFAVTKSMAVPKPPIGQKLQRLMANVRNAHDDSDDEEDGEDCPVGLQDVDAYGNDLGWFGNNEAYSTSLRSTQVNLRNEGHDSRRQPPGPNRYGPGRPFRSELSNFLHHHPEAHPDNAGRSSSNESSQDNARASTSLASHDVGPARRHGQGASLGGETYDKSDQDADHEMTDSTYSDSSQQFDTTTEESGCSSSPVVSDESRAGSALSPVQDESDAASTSSRLFVTQSPPPRAEDKLIDLTEVPDSDESESEY